MPGLLRAQFSRKFSEPSRSQQGIFTAGRYALPITKDEEVPHMKKQEEQSLSTALLQELKERGSLFLKADLEKD